MASSKASALPLLRGPETSWLHPFDDFRGRIVLVTGSSSGIGAAVAEAFAICGAHVGLHGHASLGEAEMLRDRIVSRGGKASIFAANLGTPAAAADLVRRVNAELGALHVLVNNAGNTFSRLPTPDLDERAVHRILDLNFVAASLTCAAAVPLFRSQRRGTIVNVGSISARIGGTAGSVIYAAAKAALTTFTRGLARELAPEGLRVNAVAPGVIETRIHERNTRPDTMIRFRDQIPMGRVGQAEECVGAFLFLASERLASFVTGQVIEVNGGHLMV